MTAFGSLSLALCMDSTRIPPHFLSSKIRSLGHSGSIVRELRDDSVLASRWPILTVIFSGKCVMGMYINERYRPPVLDSQVLENCPRPRDWVSAVMTVFSVIEPLESRRLASFCVESILLK